MHAITIHGGEKFLIFVAGGRLEDDQTSRANSKPGTSADSTATPIRSNGIKNEKLKGDRLEGGTSPEEKVKAEKQRLTLGDASGVEGGVARAPEKKTIGGGSADADSVSNLNGNVREFKKPSSSVKKPNALGKTRGGKRSRQSGTSGARGGNRSGNDGESKANNSSREDGKSRPNGKSKAAEKAISEDETEELVPQYAPGDLVWSKVGAFPFWPCMVIE